MEGSEPDTALGSSTTVILFGGLPASGKSTLARKVKDYFLQSNFERVVVHLEYDALEDLIVSQQHEEEERRDAWNQARRVAVHELEQQLLEHGRRAESSAPLLILMDDNFHLRGMRKQIHRLLLQYRPVNFGLVWMELPVEECLERNRQRERQIPEHVISKMHATIERPKAAWENYWMSATDTTSLEYLIEFVEMCSDIVDLPEIVDPVQQEADRVQTLKNQRHNWDKLLRTWVGQVAKHDKQLARGANMARKELLQRAKDPNSELRDDAHLLDSFLDLVLSAASATRSDSAADTSSFSVRSTLENLLMESL
jgi:tRNA uridine 5-carbamoylmethylation protein Kti12